ncbi:hypothetical protein [Maridesulfovibrio hydrothermalis]|uniref:HD domain-containing protein n=1 Tax=Maridesulfovibrio hydrothermalis AM13 = DSM 14728 TaxID=1121451 RepID=L0R8T8_9BACT|nr:hypothetical protein [Maridesulfovibrio hydrothermalis]CCO23178.1 conserved protein of unknown function [Maridesulfovibrio hydrothermalis AM13 = DSM 14728]
MNKLLIELKQEAKALASAQPVPVFYRDLETQLEFARDMFFDHPLVIRLQEDVLPFLYDEYAHGVYHSKKVAIEAGAIVLKEGGDDLPADRVRELVLLAQFCGLLHDSCRLDEDHALRGAETSRVILKNYPLSERSKDLIAESIARHEAFKPEQPIENDLELTILSGALYDADKFRWGPDNFSTTLWEICDYEDWTVAEVIEKFPKGLKIIQSIESTFRTETGKKYGPEMIAQGINIGDAIYDKLTELSKNPKYSGNQTERII